MNPRKLQKLFLTSALLCLFLGASIAHEAMGFEEESKLPYEKERILEPVEPECDISQPENLGTGEGGLFWDEVAGAMEYEVWNSTDMSIQTVMGTFINLSMFPPSNDFYVVVRAVCGEESVSEWSFLSGVSNDECVPDAPTSLTAIDPNLDWADVNGAVSYEVWNSIDLSVQTTSMSELPLMSLPEGADLTVGVRAICTNGDASDWAFLSGVFIDDCVPDVPVNLVIIGESTLDWDEVTDAVEYEVWNSESNSIQTVPSSEIAFSALPSSTSLNIGVRAVCPNGSKSGWAFINNINTSDCDLDKPTGLTENGTIFDWDDSAAAVMYEVWNSESNSIQTVASSEIAFSALPQVTGLTIGIRAICSDGAKSKWAFKSNVITNGCSLDAPTGLSENGTTLDWDDAPGADHYEVWNSENNGMQMVMESELPLSSLPSGSSVDIGVRAVCPDGVKSAWTFINDVEIINLPALAFLTNGTLQENNEIIQRDHNVSRSEVNIFPNPVSNQVLNIRMQDGTQVIQRISLYSLTGQMMQQVDNVEHSQYQLQLPSNVSAGTYLIRIEGANFAIAKPLIIR